MFSYFFHPALFRSELAPYWLAWFALAGETVTIYRMMPNPDYLYSGLFREALVLILLFLVREKFAAFVWKGKEKPHLVWYILPIFAALNTLGRLIFVFGI